MAKILGIYGAGGLGREVLELARVIDLNSPQWGEIFFIVDGSEQNSLHGCRILSFEEALRYRDQLEVTVAVGEPASRQKLFDKIQAQEIPLATLIHPQVVIPASTAVGKGTTIQLGAFIAPDVTIGERVFVQPHVNIGHDDVIGTGCVLSGMVNLGGNVHIGANSYLGLSASVKEEVSIGTNCVLGMGSVLFSDLPDEMIALGNPARPMRKNVDHKVFK